MATTSIDTKRDLISIESLAYMRAIDIKFEVTDCKPRCRMHAVFDNVQVNEYITPQTGPDSGIRGGRIFANEDGDVRGIFHVPPMTFQTGTKEFKLTENPKPLLPEIPGSLYGYALADFTSTGINQIYQNTITITNVTTVVLPPPEPATTTMTGDPLAQSFFTEGVEGGCFLTSIDIYVNRKDEEIPLILEIREMINGYPGPALIDTNARVSIPSADILVSEDASIPTNFKFNRPYYLEEDKDYAFVLMTNSQSYFVFTCTMGERSLETKKIVFEQPYLGSLFKSQNNQTWTAEQYEDIKFKLYIAEFDTSVNAVVEMSASAPPTTIDTSNLRTTSGSNVIRAELTFDHNLELNNKVRLDIDPKGVYNGIPAASLTGTYNVTSVLGPRAFEFVVGANATSTGKIEHGGFIASIIVDNQGFGYDESDPPLVTIADPASGVTATAKPIIEEGKVVRIEITHNGSGYTHEPTITIIGATGLGCTARTSMNLKASIMTNRAYSIVTPGIGNLQLAGTKIDSSFSYTKGNYEGANITSYAPGEPIPFNLSSRNWLPQNAWLVSFYNEEAMMVGKKSAQLSMVLSSSNKNISPVIELNSAHAMFSGNLVNNQKDEDFLSDEPFSSISSITLVGGGAGYAIPPTIEFVNQYGCEGTGAEAEASISNGAVNSITLLNPGSGYTKPPYIVFNGQNTVSAAATVEMAPFNSELAPDKGSARSRYLTKINRLSSASESAKILVEAYSGHNSNFDVYFRSSLKASGVDHKTMNWTLMNCDVETNMSKRDGEYLEYNFYLNNIEKYDTYDIKIVFRSADIVDVPWIRNFRAIMSV